MGKIKVIKRGFLTIYLIGVFSVFQTNAQIHRDSLKSVKYGVLPVLAFNSDRGFVIGGEVQEFDYRGNDHPFKSYSVAKVVYNSIGAFSLGYSRDQVRTFNTKIRTRFSFFSILNYGSYYPGVTVNESFSKQQFDTTLYYHYDSFRIKTNLSTRWPFHLGDFIERSDTRIALEWVYEKPFGYEENSYLNQIKPSGYDLSSSLLLEIGWIIERRNSEFQALKGYRLASNTIVTLPRLSTHSYVKTQKSLSYFYPFWATASKSVSLATNVQLEYAWGDVPFWNMPQIGGINLRGYMLRRAVGFGMINYTLEMRSWLINLPYKNIRLGFNTFVDGGAVYKKRIQFNEPHLLTAGIGGALSIFTPDYILKYDVGFSKEGIGVYIGTGFNF